MDVGVSLLAFQSPFRYAKYAFAVTLIFNLVSGGNHE